MNNSKHILYRYAVGTIVTVELKSGKHQEEYTGLLLECDRHLNLHIGDVQIRKDSQINHQREAFIRGTAVKGIRLEKSVITAYMQNREERMVQAENFEAQLLKAETLEKLRLMEIKKEMPVQQQILVPSITREEIHVRVPKEDQDFSHQKSHLIIQTPDSESTRFMDADSDYSQLSTTESTFTMFNSSIKMRRQQKRRLGQKNTPQIGEKSQVTPISMGRGKYIPKIEDESCKGIWTEKLRATAPQSVKISEIPMDRFQTEVKKKSLNDDLELGWVPSTSYTAKKKIYGKSQVNKL